ncbi:hypothetical protein OESDEN_06721 [Oesophagostomum dentatum]|uniref:Uncharacterized protein n=1 Tax=Oesophagostomum dentatum TaxID=61180 RepID=A0A0B1TB46_OESDE|nr:hypothetical protein OESDEN_06721 [Oesophagostomum dentatum]
MSPASALPIQFHFHRYHSSGLKCAKLAHRIKGRKLLQRKLLALSVGKNSVQMAARSVQRRQLGMSVGRNSTQIGARSVQRNTSAIGVNRKSAQMVPKAPEAPIQTNATETHPRYDVCTGLSNNFVRVTEGLTAVILA